MTRRESSESVVVCHGIMAPLFTPWSPLVTLDPGLDDRTRVVPRLGIPDDAVINSLRKKCSELVLALDGVFAERRRMFHGFHVQPPEAEIKATYEALLKTKPIAKPVLCQAPPDGWLVDDACSLRLSAACLLRDA